MTSARLRSDHVDRSRSGPRLVTIQPTRSLLSFSFTEMWLYRELLYLLIWRDVKVRYKQTAIGAAWAIVRPLVTMVVFTIVFGTFARLPSDGIPYPLFAYAALLPWNYFAQALSGTANSVIADAGLIRKVYFPRLLLPLAAVITPIIDFAVAFVVLLAMMAWFGITPTPRILLLPLFLVLSLTTALSVGLWFAGLNVRYRDIGLAIPFIVQVWLFASPVAYSARIVPDRWRALYAVNPIAGVVEGFRWALLGTESPDLLTMMMSVPVIAILLVGGLLFFARTERTFADIV